MRGVWLLTLAGLVIVAGFGTQVGAIRHDAACRPAGFTFTDSPDTWIFADKLNANSCIGEMHPTAGGMWPDDHDWSYINVASGSTQGISVTICPIFVFVNPWNPDLKVYFLPGGASLPASQPAQGQTMQAFQPALSKIPLPLAVGSSSNGAGCDTVTGAPPAPLTSGGGRYYIDVVRGTGGGGYSFSASLV